MHRLSRLKRYVVLGSAAAAAHGVDVGTFGDIDVLTSEEEVTTVLEDGDVQFDYVSGNLSVRSTEKEYLCRKD